MAAKTEFVRARINPDLKNAVQDILKKLGLTQTEAITLFYNQIVLHNGLPFELKIPNKYTKQAIRDVEREKNLDYASSKEDFFSQLED